MPIRTRTNSLATDHENVIFSRSSVSIVKLMNIKEGKADSACDRSNAAKVVMEEQEGLKIVCLIFATIKARLVAKGLCAQEEGIDFEVSFALIALAWEAVRILLPRRNSRFFPYLFSMRLDVTVEHGGYFKLRPPQKAPQGGSKCYQSPAHIIVIFAQNIRVDTNVILNEDEILLEVASYSSWAHDPGLRARDYCPALASISLPPEAEVERLLAMTTPSSSPPISLSPPIDLINAVTAALPSSLLLQTTTISYNTTLLTVGMISFESEQPPRKRVVFVHSRLQYKIGEIFNMPVPIGGQGVDLWDTWVDPAEAVPMTVEEVNTRVTELVELHEHDTQDLLSLLGGCSGAALTWWNGQIRTLDPEAYAMTWEVLKKVDGTSIVVGEIMKTRVILPGICTKFVANETEKVDKYISGLPDNIYGNVKSARPKTLDETIELANDLMMKPTIVTNNNPSRGRMSPRSTGNTNVANTQKGNGAAPKGNGCFECGAPGHFKRDCPKL
ncbi:reverse transcriptase domain-containing protein [Tanacetum coccineum]